MQKQNKAKFRSFTKRFQCIVCVTFMLLMTISTVPIETLIASAASEYNLYIDGEMVTSDNAKDILGNGIFSYDPNKNKLTINGDYTSKSNQSLIEYKSRNKELTIYVAGDSCLVKDFMTSAMYLTGNTTITGPGSLTIKSQNLAVLLRYATLNIFDANVYFVETDVDSVAYTFNGDNGTLNIKNSNVEIVCCDRSSNSAIEGLSEMNLDNCSINVPRKGKFEGGRIIDNAGKSAQRVKITKGENPDGVEYSVIPNTKTIKKNCYNDSDYKKGIFSTLKFSAAGNERESGQIILNSDSYVENITIEKSTLNGPNGNFISADDVEVFFERYIYESENNWYFQDTIGDHADALLPYNLAVNQKQNNLEISKGNNQGIWFTLKVPAEKASGTYKGEYIIKYNGGSFVVPVEVTVFNFDLPDQTYSCNFFTTCMGDPDTPYKKEAVEKVAGYTDFNKYQQDIDKFISVRKINTGLQNNRDRSWALGVLANHNKVDISNYADKVYEYVKTSPTPYYNIDFGSDEIPAASIFKEEDFNIIDEYLCNLNNSDKLSEIINKKKAQIKAILDDYKGKQLSQELENDEIITTENSIKYLTDTECNAIDYAVDYYLYFDLQYFTGTLNDEAKKYVSENCINDYKNRVENETKKAFLEYLSRPDKDEQVPEDEAITNKEIKDQEYVSGIKGNVKVPDLGRLYTGLCLFEEDAAIKTIQESNGKYTDEDIELLRGEVRNLSKPLRSQLRLSQYDFLHHNELCSMNGMESIIECLVDKSFKERIDLLKYAYFYHPKLDEPMPYDYWANYNILLASKVLDETKEDVINYINEKYKSDPLRLEIISSVDSILLISTYAATSKSTYNTEELGRFVKEVRAYSSMLYNGLGYFKLGDAEETLFSSVFKPYYEAGMNAQDAVPYVVILPANYTLHSFCPLFNDFSKTVGSAFDAKDNTATMEALDNSNIRMWWYSCVSNGNSFLAAHCMNGNVNNSGTKFRINGNGLAIERINKWQQYKLGIEGELYWAVDDYVYRSTESYVKDVWNQTCQKCNEGLLIYPIFSFAKYNLNMNDGDAKDLCDAYGYFASSIRLENISESCDDYDYLCIANDLIKKAALAGASDDEITYWRNYINGLYDSMFDDVNYDENANSENLRIAREKLARFIENLQVKTQKAAIYEITPGNMAAMDFKFSRSDGKYLSDFIHLDCNTCTASVGTLTKKGSTYEYILPVGDLPTTTDFIADGSWEKVNITTFKFDNEKNKIVADEILENSREIVDLVTPIRSNGYTVSRFWNYYLDADDCCSDWQNSNKKAVFNIKATPMNCEKVNDNSYCLICLVQKQPWATTTEQLKLDPIKGELTRNVNGEKIGTIEKCSDDYDGWYHVEIPYSALNAYSDNRIKNSIDIIAADWINCSYVIKDIEIVDSSTFEPPTNTRPVNRTIWGDANCDSVVELSDAILIMQSIANPNKYGINGTSPSAITEKGKELADVDTTVKGLTGNDALKIQKYLLKLISSLDPSE